MSDNQFDYQYDIDDFKTNEINRTLNNSLSNEQLPIANKFIDLFENKQIRETYNWKITNKSNGLLVLHPNENIIFRDNIYIISENETFEFIACIFNLEPVIIGIVKK